MLPFLWRSLQMAFWRACILYIMQGKQWTDDIATFASWTLDYDLWVKMHFFGESILNQETAEQGRERRGPQNLLDLLPNEFTRQEAQQLRQRLGIRTGSLCSMLGTWKHRGYIENCNDPLTTPPEKRIYRKTDIYVGKEKAGT